VEPVQANVPVSVLQLAGELDAASYLQVIEQVKALYAAGGRDLLVDLSELTFLASSGLVALHSAALIMRGDTLPDLESGWQVLHAIAREVDARTEMEAHCKLLNPQPRVQKALSATGFDRFLAIYEDRDTALASFG
jgi:anti-anti-sigma regulatory factor